MKFSIMFSVVVPPTDGSAGYLRSIGELRKLAGLIEDLCQTKGGYSIVLFVVQRLAIT